MPVPSLSGSVQRWPAAAEVLEQAGSWAAEQQRCQPDLLAVGVFGSYGRGTAGVGSDLDLLLILNRCDEPIWDRLRRWDTRALPLACDLLVYSHEEWRSLPQWNPKLAEALLNDTRWLGSMREAMAAAADMGMDLAESVAAPAPAEAHASTPHPAADQAAITNVDGVTRLSGGGGLIQSTSG